MVINDLLLIVFIVPWALNRVTQSRVVKMPERKEAIKLIALIKFFSIHACCFQKVRSKKLCKSIRAATPEMEYCGLSVVHSCSSTIHCLYSASGSFWNGLPWRQSIATPAIRHCSDEWCEARTLHVSHRLLLAMIIFYGKCQLSNISVQKCWKSYSLESVYIWNGAFKNTDMKSNLSFKLKFKFKNCVYSQKFLIFHLVHQKGIWLET